METSQQVPVDAGDGCGWLFGSNSEEFIQESLSMLTVAEQDAKQKIDDELTNLRDRLHMILNEQRLNSEFIFGVNASNEMCQETDQNMIAYAATDCQSHYNQYEEHQYNYQDESGMGSLGSDSVQYDVDNSSNHSVLSPMKTEDEATKNCYLLRILTAAMKICHHSAS